jgi:hypothetical protein
MNPVSHATNLQTVQTNRFSTQRKSKPCNETTSTTVTPCRAQQIRYRAVVGRELPPPFLPGLHALFCSLFFRSNMVCPPHSGSGMFPSVVRQGETPKRGGRAITDRKKINGPVEGYGWCATAVSAVRASHG